MKRVCVFAHWDRDNIIDEYVLYYLKALKDVADSIIFVSDCDLKENETKKLDGIADFICAQKHGEYDFGSYKRGFLLAIEKGLEFDELIFANDSCYGPIYPLNTIFAKMEKKKFDFWGMTGNRYGVLNEGVPVYTKLPVVPHIQSYFLVLKKNVFMSKIFVDFINSIQKESEKNDIINKYEIGLSQLLYKNGFRSAKFINKYNFVCNPPSIKWDKMVKNDGYPFIKTAIIRNGFCITGEVKGWQDIIKRVSDYPVEIIEKNANRLLNLYENTYSQFNIYRKIRYWILKDAPPEIRYLVIMIEKYSYIILNKLCFNKLKKF